MSSISTPPPSVEIAYYRLVNRHCDLLAAKFVNAWRHASASDRIGHESDPARRRIRRDRARFWRDMFEVGDQADGYRVLVQCLARHPRFAASVVATIPVIVLFALIERRVINGLTAGSIK